MSRYAVVCDGQVVNVTLWDGETEWTPDEGCTLHKLPDDSPVGPGWSCDGSTFTPGVAPVTPASVPVQVDPQALAALIDQASAATTVAATKKALVALIDLLNPAAPTGV